MASEQAAAHRSLADVVDAIEAMGVDVENSGIDYAGDETTEATIELTMTGDLIIPTADELETGADPALVEQLQDDLDEAEAEIEELEESLGNAEDAITELHEERDALETERDEAVAEVKRLNEQLADAPSAEEVADLEEEIDFLEDQLDDVRETLDERNEQLDEARRRAQRAEGELEDGGGCGAEDGLPGTEELFGTVGIPEGSGQEEADEEPEDVDEPEREAETVDAEDDADQTGDEDVGEADELPEALRDQLTPGQTTLLEAMAGEGWMTSSEVIEAAPGLAAGTVQGYLSKLSGGPIESRADPDDEDGVNRQQYRLDGAEESDGGEDVQEAEDTVYVMTGSDGDSSSPQKYHEDEECLHLQQANNYHEKPRDSVPHHEPCETCPVEDVVYVTSGVTSPSPTYHEREDCPSVKKADSVREVGRDDLVNKEPCKRCAIEEDEEPDPDDVEIPAECEWLGRPADMIVEDATRVERDLEEVLDIVGRADGWLQVHKRIAAPTTSVTKDLLWELGLREQSGALHEDDVLEERIAAIRGCYLE